MSTPLTRRLAACALALAATTGHAEVVALNYANSLSEVHEYFVDDPAIAGWVQVGGSSGSWNLQRGVLTNVESPGFNVGTGAAVEACCQAENHNFQWDMTVAGVTRALNVTVRMTEIANDQYQVDVLDAAPVVFDLGAIGLLTLDMKPLATQFRANTPLYFAIFGQATALLSGPALGVPTPGSLPLAGVALAGLVLLRRRAV